MPDRQQLTELQIAVLRLLWEQGELTVAQIWEELYPDRKLAQMADGALARPVGVGPRLAEEMVGSPQPRAARSTARRTGWPMGRQKA